jgi:hypothetical protein
MGSVGEVVEQFTGGRVVGVARTVQGVLSRFSA